MAAKLGSGDVSFRLGSATPAKVALGSAEVWTPDPWAGVLNSSFGANIAAAYDFREIDGSTLDGRVGPQLSLTGVTATADGGLFGYSGSVATSSTTVTITYPVTLVFVANSDSSAGEINYMSLSANQSASSDQVAIFSRNSQSLMPYNGVDNQQTTYYPDGLEWYFCAMSFDGIAAVQYRIRAASGNLGGSLTGGTLGSPSFSAYPLFGKWFNNDWGCNGTMRLAVAINQGFSSDEEMDAVFDVFKAGPIADLFP